MSEDTNVVLTGFMATGKSAVGRLLAERLDFEWVDTDVVIATRHGPIADIFSSNGEEAFRDRERGLAAELASRSRLVISTGGGMMLDDGSATALGERSRVFCLTATSGEILQRVSDAEELPRPLLAGAHPAQRIDELLAARRSGYAEFEQVATDGRSVVEVVEDILGRL